MIKFDDKLFSQKQPDLTVFFCLRPTGCTLSLCTPSPPQKKIYIYIYIYRYMGTVDDVGFLLDKNRRFWILKSKLKLLTVYITCLLNSITWWGLNPINVPYWPFQFKVQHRIAISLLLFLQKRKGKRNRWEFHEHVP